MNPSDFSPWHGVFETVRVIGGQPLFLDEHLASLHESTVALGLKISANLAARAQYLKDQTGRWRWVVNRDGTYDFFLPEDRPLPANYSVAVAPQRLGSQNWDARYKTFSYLTHAQARQWAQEQKADEAILLNENGDVASAAMANVFWVRKSKISTPPLAAGCRNGIVRQWVIENAKAGEGTSTAAELEKSDEIFLTNSMIGIMPVTRCGKRVLKLGPKTTALQKRFRDFCAKRWPAKSAASTGSGSIPAP